MSHYKHLSEMVLMMVHKIYFYGEIWPLSLNYPCYPFLTGALNEYELHDFPVQTIQQSVTNNTKDHIFGTKYQHVARILAGIRFLQ